MNTPDTLVVAVVDDHWSVLQGALVGLHAVDRRLSPGVGAMSVAELLRVDQPRQSDVVLLDLDLGDGTRAQNNVTALREHGYAVVIFTAEVRPARLTRTLGLGAHAVVSKSDGPEELSRSVWAAFHNAAHDAAQVDGGRSGKPVPLDLAEPVISPFMMRIIMSAPALPHLPPQPTEVLRLLVAGVDVRSVAKNLFIEESTVREYVKQIYRAFRDVGYVINNRIALARAAVESGAIEDPDLSW